MIKLSLNSHVKQKQKTKHSFSAFQILLGIVIYRLSRSGFFMMRDDILSIGESSLVSADWPLSNGMEECKEDLLGGTCSSGETRISSPFLSGSVLFVSCVFKEASAISPKNLSILCSENMWSWIYLFQNNILPVPAVCIFHSRNVILW